MQITPYSILNVCMQITAISKLNKQRGAEGLTSARVPAWHANLLVSYPQVLDVDFGYVHNVRQLLFLPQKRRSARAPRAVRIEGGNKLGRWQEIYSGELDCSGKQMEESYSHECNVSNAT